MDGSCALAAAAKDKREIVREASNKVAAAVRVVDTLPLPDQNTL